MPSGKVLFSLKPVIWQLIHCQCDADSTMSVHSLFCEVIDRGMQLGLSYKYIVILPSMFSDVCYVFVKISCDDRLNPIKQDVKKGQMRFVANCFPHHGTMERFPRYINAYMGIVWFKAANHWIKNVCFLEWLKNVHVQKVYVSSSLKLEVHCYKYCSVPIFNDWCWVMVSCLLT